MLHDLVPDLLDDEVPLGGTEPGASGLLFWFERYHAKEARQGGWKDLPEALRRPAKRHVCSGAVEVFLT